MKKFCQKCGKEYEIAKSQEYRSKFCSDKCFRENKNTQIVYNCDYCHKPFLVRKSKVKKRNNGITKSLCCSVSCSQNIQKPKWDDICKMFKDKCYDLKSTEYIKSKEKLEYVCLKHKEKGSQFITYNNLKNGFGCKYCGIESTKNHLKLNFKDVKEIFLNNDMKLLDEQEYYNNTQKLAYICVHHPEHGVQYMSTSNAYKNHCPFCKKSKGEDIISKYLLSNKIKFISQYKFKDLKGVKGGKLSYDFYLPDYNLLIEYQGEFHDGNVNDKIQTYNDLVIQKEHDYRKKKYAENHNIQLLEIWYYDFKNIETILNNILIKK